MRFSSVMLLIVVFGVKNIPNVVFRFWGCSGDCGLLCTSPSPFVVSSSCLDFILVCSCRFSSPPPVPTCSHSGSVLWWEIITPTLGVCCDEGLLLPSGSVLWWGIIAPTLGVCYGGGLLLPLWECVVMGDYCSHSGSVL